MKNSTALMSFKILGYKYERNVIKHVLESKNHSEIMVIEVKVVNKLVVSLYETVTSGKKTTTTKTIVERSQSLGI